ncbi:MAG: Ldh family oxidoreductase [Candidatus Latescibacterota bacterium]|nr:Ldh family oxidoreductase [Candidatus Latescibacterota bacterium]MEC8991076.1 Ldh family oxidoreductase [Candidatus Latescibacterota bacterium]MEE3040718.1 Ldh family oxidoreductase [Candidatus Latescibacterota bacterium]MEE3335468.1 Ldh family oxidoreductase [Candidatus Latescibacterota bacterium]
MTFRSRNYPPEHGILIPRSHQRQVIRDLLGSTAMRPSDADYLADRLVANDGRCLYSHGSRQLPHYLENLNGGNINPEPNVEVVSAFGATARVDGDGGLGYMACRVGMDHVLACTAKLGMGACSTGNHHHVGSVGMWTRMAVEKGYIGMAVSAQRNTLDSKNRISRLPNSAPLSIGFPHGEQPPLILDMGSSFMPDDTDMLQRLPHAYFKTIGLSAAIQTLGGVLAGIYREELTPPVGAWMASQGAFLCAWDVRHFADVDEYTAEMDRFTEKARAMQPLPGLDRAELPGGMEWQWEKDNQERGIPLGDEHRDQLEALAMEAGVDCGYDQFEKTRF